MTNLISRYQYTEAVPPKSGFVFFDPQNPNSLQVSYTDYDSNDNTTAIQALQNGQSISCRDMVWTITGNNTQSKQSTFSVTPASGLVYGPGVYDFSFGDPAPTQPEPVTHYTQFTWLIDISGQPAGYVNMSMVELIKPLGTDNSTIQIGNRAFDVQGTPLSIVTTRVDQS